MFLSMWVSTAKYYLRGSWLNEAYNDNDVCVLDIDDMVLETYRLTKYNRFRKRLHVHNAKLGDDIGIYCFDLFADGRLHGDSEKISNTRAIYFNDDLVFSLYNKDVINARTLTVRANGVILFRLKCDYPKWARINIFFGQRLERNLYRILFCVHSMNCNPGERIVICAIFSETQFLGVEYVFRDGGGEIEFNEALKVRGAVGAKLALL